MEYNSAREEADEYESADDGDDDDEEKDVDLLSIQEDDQDVIKRSTLKRQELRAGKYNRSNRHSPNLLDLLDEDKRSCSESGKV